MATGIYTITSPTQKIYVGQSICFENRIKQYARLSCKDQIKIYNSLKKHGWENHQFNLIMPLKEDISQSQLDFWEQFFIDYYRNEGFELLNLKEGGSKGKLSQETKEKIRKIRTGSKFSTESKLKMSMARKGKKLSDSVRANMKLGQAKRLPPSKETRIKHSIAAIKSKISRKLTEEKVKLIINDLTIDKSISFKALGLKYGVNRTTIADIYYGRTWSWLTGIKNK